MGLPWGLCRCLVVAISCGIWVLQAAVSSDRALSAARPACWLVQVLLSWVRVAWGCIPRGDPSLAAGSRDLGVRDGETV